MSVWANIIPERIALDSYETWSFEIWTKLLKLRKGSCCDAEGWISLFSVCYYYCCCCLYISISWPAYLNEELTEMSDIHSCHIHWSNIHTHTMSLYLTNQASGYLTVELSVTASIAASELYKVSHKSNLLLISSPNIDRFSKFCHWCTRHEIGVKRSL